MNEYSTDHIRKASFPVALRGYDKDAVQRYLGKLADWLEMGGADDDIRSDEVRQELERIGEHTSEILIAAEDAAERIRADAEQVLLEAREEAETTRAEAERYATEKRTEADAYAERTRVEADTYSKETREGADAEAAKMRKEAETYGNEVRTQADADATERREKAEAEAEQIVAAGREESAQLEEDRNVRRREISEEIADLQRRRAVAVKELERIASDVVGTATLHRVVTGGEESPSEEGAEGASSAEGAAQQSFVVTDMAAGEEESTGPGPTPAEAEGAEGPPGGDDAGGDADAPTTELRGVAPS